MQCKNIGFPNGPVFRYGNFFIPRVEISSKISTRAKNLVLPRANFWGFFNTRDEEIFIPENHGPFGNCIHVWVNQAKFLWNCCCTSKKKSDSRMAHVEIRFLITSAMTISKRYGNLSRANPYTNSYRNRDLFRLIEWIFISIFEKFKILLHKHSRFVELAASTKYIKGTCFKQM